MRNNFNEQSKLWSCMDRKTQHAQNAIIGHRILNSLIENGSKVAQVFTKTHAHNQLFE